MSDRVRVLLVDDHALVRKGVRLYLESQPDFEIVGEVGSGEAALAMVEDQAPDLVLMDLMMPGMGGVEATRRIKSISPATTIVVLTREVILESRVAAQMISALQAPTVSGNQRVLAELTGREMDVLRLIAEGMTNAQIANRLFISDKTVKTHVSNILWKLQLADRTQAAVFAWKEGLVSGS